MNKNIKLSILIPVYNTEDYIERCLNSIINQNLNHYEIVIINDGSTDNSEAVIKKIIDCNQDISIVYYKQDNMGVSKARNVGINLARGEYIHFIDSDDYLVENVYKNVFDLIKFSKGIDMIELGYNVIKKDKFLRTVYPINSSKDDSYSYLIESLSKNLYEWYPWKYIIKKSVFIENKLEFPIGINYEDVYLIPRIIEKVSKIYSIDLVVYNYILGRDGAITNGLNVNNEINKLTVSALNIEYFEKINSLEYKHLIQDNFSHMYYSALIVLYLAKGDERIKLYDCLKKYKYIISYTKSGPQKLLKILIKVMGIRLTSILLYIRMVIKNGFKTF